jgi:two-component system, sensor histidine kinase and response regulator
MGIVNALVNPSLPSEQSRLIWLERERATHVSFAPQRFLDRLQGGDMMDEPLARPSILVVDDTIENLQLLSRILAQHAYEVRPVTSGRQALQAATNLPPELILLDVVMPELDGYEVCRRLKELDDLRAIPVIFLTAMCEPDDKIKAFAAGGADYITKPFQVDEVLARVRLHIALRQSHIKLAQSYERLRSLERFRDDLVQMLVHDMLSPLSALTVLLADVQNDCGGELDQHIREQLRFAVEAARSVNRMANDILDVSRLEERKLPLDRKPNDVAEICREVASHLGMLDRTRAIDVDGTEPTEIVCDRGIVFRVVENIVSNAIKHTPRGGRIRIRTGINAGRARVTIRDEGHGIPLEARTKIFEKFGTLEVRRDMQFHSTGLGLAFCKLAVEAHGGTIGVERGEPSGSIFWFEMPA